MPPFTPLTAAPFVRSEGSGEQWPRMALRPPAAGCARQSRPSGHRCAASARADPPVFPGWTPVIDFPVLPSTPVAFQRSRCSLGAHPRRALRAAGRTFAPCAHDRLSSPAHLGWRFRLGERANARPAALSLAGCGGAAPHRSTGAWGPLRSAFADALRTAAPPTLRRGLRGAWLNARPRRCRSPAWPQHRPTALLK